MAIPAPNIGTERRGQEDVAKQKKNNNNEKKKRDIRV